MAEEVTPFPKSVQLARGERRYRRKAERAYGIDYSRGAAVGEE